MKVRHNPSMERGYIIFDHIDLHVEVPVVPSLTLPEVRKWRPCTSPKLSATVIWIGVIGLSGGYKVLFGFQYY